MTALPDSIFEQPWARRGPRRAVLLTAFGREQSLNAWQRETGLTVPVISRRLARGLGPEEALSPERETKNAATWEPVIDEGSLRHLYFVERMTIAEIADTLDVTSKVIEVAMRRFAIKARVAAKRDQWGPKNLQWKGGVIIDGAGYVLLKMPEHPRANCRGYVKEHVVVAERKIGRPLAWFGKNDPRNEIVHHDDENKRNNHPDNLIVTTQPEHMRLHNSRRHAPEAAE